MLIDKCLLFTRPKILQNSLLSVIVMRARCVDIESTGSIKAYVSTLKLTRKMRLPQNLKNELLSELVISKSVKLVEIREVKLEPVLIGRFTISMFTTCQTGSTTVRNAALVD